MTKILMSELRQGEEEARRRLVTWQEVSEPRLRRAAGSGCGACLGDRLQALLAEGSCTGPGVTAEPQELLGQVQTFRIK